MADLKPEPRASSQDALAYQEMSQRIAGFKTALKVKHLTSEKSQVLNLIAKHDGLTKVQLYSRLNYTTAKIDRHLQELIDEASVVPRYLPEKSTFVFKVNPKP